MPNLKIVKNYFVELRNKPPKIPRERFTRFYEDLYAQFDLGAPDPMSYQQGSQYNYAELGDGILKQCEADGILKNLELLIVCYWTPEFDPEYSAGAYFCERYSITGKTFDVCDQGLLSPIMALKLIKSYFNHTDIKNALLLCLDQTTIPAPKSGFKNLPKKSSALGIFIKKNKDNSVLDLIHAKISPDSEALFFAGKISKAQQFDIGFSKADFPYLNCAEILRPIIYQNSSSEKKESYFMLRISDFETRDYGFLLGRS